MTGPKTRENAFGGYGDDLQHVLLPVLDMYRSGRQEHIDQLVSSEEWSRVSELRAVADEIADIIRKRAYTLTPIGDRGESNDVYQAYEQYEQEQRNRVEKQIEELHKIFLVRQAQYRKELGPREAEQKIAEMRDLLQQITASFRSSVNRTSQDYSDPEQEGDSVLRLVWEKLCIDEAYEIILDLGDRANRVLQLERLVARWMSRPAPARGCVRFLALIGRCFVAGYGPECVVMCRGAMDSAFREKISDLDCEYAGRKGKEKKLADRIYAAFCTPDRLLGRRPELHRTAENIKQRGDKAIHYDPEATTDVLGTIEGTLQVIEALAALQDA